jgi:hypothetical protein
MLLIGQAKTNYLQLVSCDDALLNMRGEIQKHDIFAAEGSTHNLDRKVSP